MNGNSSKSKPNKPRANAAADKPYPDFPLTPHKSGRWRKIHGGKAYYFGPLDDWQAAYDRYTFEWPYIIAGKPIPDRHTGNAEGVITVADVVNSFIETKRELMDNGELSPRTFADTIRTGKYIVKAIDRNRDIETVGPDDFAKLRKVLAEGRSLVALGVLITRCRSVFKYAVDSGLRDSAVRYGQAFARPKRKAVRKQRSKKPERFFTAEECRTLIEAAPVQLKAMILLALNAGLGNTDLGLLALSHVDLDAGVVAMPRPKTGAARRAVLWPETIKAVREAIDARPTPERDAEGLVFVTRTGKPWVRARMVEKETKPGKVESKLSQTDAVGGEFKKLLKATKLEATGRAFYALRHTFRSVADAVNDRPAVDLIMGHDDPADMRSHYVAGSRITDDRLKAVTDHVRAWIWPKPAKKKTKKKRSRTSARK